MSDFKVELIRALEAVMPELKTKIQAEPVDADTAVPYIAYSTPSESPVRTKDGIIGYNTMFELVLIVKRIEEVVPMKIKIIKALDKATLGDKTASYMGGKDAPYTEKDTHGFIMTFKIY